jgi:hypothetical protein
MHEVELMLLQPWKLARPSCWQKIKKYKGVLISSGMMFILILMKDRQLVRKLLGKGRYMDRRKDAWTGGHTDMLIP